MIRLSRSIWVALRFDRLCLEIIERTDDRPTAVVENHRIYASDHEAVEPGLAVATAQALVANLMTTMRQVKREHLAMQQLALWAYAITPHVVIADDNTLLLDIGGCRKLYRDLSILLESSCNELHGRGHHVCLGVAHTPKAAWLLASTQTEPAWKNSLELNSELLYSQLAALPIDGLPVDPKIITRVQHMGIETLGRFLQFDWPLLGKRFGAEFIRYLQQLTGHIPDPQLVIELPPHFEQHLSFLDGVTNRQSFLFPMRRLLQALSDYLIARQLHCRAFEWQFSDAHSVKARMCVELSQPHHRWKAMLDLSQLKLDAIELPELVFTLTLCAKDFLPVAANSTELFEEDRADDESHFLFDKLMSRLGSNALHRLTPQPSLWPEAASTWTALHEPLNRIDEIPQGPRPTFLLPRPEPLRHRNRQLVWQQPLQLLRGPERIESPPQLGEVRSRDYFVAQETSGRVCWVFRELDTGNWFIHGVFA